MSSTATHTGKQQSTAGTLTCEKHVGVKVIYETPRYGICPLCEALDKIADYEIGD